MTTFEEVTEELPGYLTEEVAQAYWDNQPWYWETCDVKEFMDSLEEAYQGVFDSELDFGTEVANDIGMIDETSESRHYFDYDAFTRDLFMGDYWSESVPNGYAIFRAL